MPYQGDTTLVNTTAPSTPAGTATPTVAVIPAVDLFLGTVTITAKAGTEQFRHAQPQLIAQALAQAVRPTHWCESSKTLTVTVAAVGKRAGVQRHFTLGH
ncbi:hypothetical protein [Paenarthrobacter nitroguajacolicus]|uniref:hypothetical protein n=1 Tax=Paenarthrobacter nitroguajacolicus TaxID=211146 RepID=UPI0015C1C1E1|nr:hypothetical protein [Paenarthrobacter nitroguajacolicus]NWL11381.1 hypothetical protein [Paenarthrobacter nitroguajacolicus]NWL34071.1 hypothetical protein [Paenarthrobacter nitroguajacolicus]